MIRGWDYGLPTMKRGEVATLYIRPEYAYGDNGFHDVIGPGETLAIEVQLWDWRGKLSCQDSFLSLQLCLTGSLNVLTDAVMTNSVCAQ